MSPAPSDIHQFNKVVNVNFFVMGWMKHHGDVLVFTKYVVFRVVMHCFPFRRLGQLNLLWRCCGFIKI